MLKVWTAEYESRSRFPSGMTTKRAGAKARAWLDQRGCIDLIFWPDQIGLRMVCDSIFAGSSWTLKPGPVGSAMWAFSGMSGLLSKW
jgi:hypothetical protein